MNSPFFNGFSPTQSSLFLKRMIKIISSASILIALLNSPLFRPLLPWDITSLFILSREGIENGWLWQLITYSLIEDPYYGIHFGLLFNLLFNMLMLWIFGSSLIEYFGEKAFVIFYLLSSLFIGLVTVGCMMATNQSYYIAGCNFTVFSVFAAWTYLYKDAEVLFFFMFRFKAKWLLLGTLGTIFLVNVSQGTFIHFIAYLASAIFAFMYCSYTFDSISLSEKILLILKELKKRWVKVDLPLSSKSKKGKIIDFHTGEAVLDDEEFVDAMLEKISISGEKSLNASQKERLQKISEAKKRNRGKDLIN